MSVAYDEFGTPFFVVKNQEEKKRVKGPEAYKANILAAKCVADTLRTSFGPLGMDKIIISPDGSVTVTNDGATILDKMEVDNQCAKLLVELSKSQDEQVGDGTTGVVVMAGALLEHALHLIEKGVHPTSISHGFEKAAKLTIEQIKNLCTKMNIYENNSKVLKDAAKTALNSKVVSNEKTLLATICVDAILSVADLETKQVNFDLIKIVGLPQGELKNSSLVQGLVLNKEISHSQMPKVVKNAKIAVLACPFEPPKPKIKHKLDIQTVDDLRELEKAEHDYFEKMVKIVVDSGANFVACQWGFDDEANHLLYQNNIPALRWVGGVELEMLAVATQAKIVGRFEDLTSDKLGFAEYIKETTFGADSDKQTVIQNFKKSKAVTIVLQAGNQIVLSEGERCVHDSLCCIRNLIVDNSIVPGGGAAEISASIAVEKHALEKNDFEQLVYFAFSDALLRIPMALSENSGLPALDIVAEAKNLQLSQNNPNLGIDCVSGCVQDMISINVHESLVSKIHQIELATQVVRMILKIDDIIVPNDY